MVLFSGKTYDLEYDISFHVSPNVNKQNTVTVPAAVPGLNERILCFRGDALTDKKLSKTLDLTGLAAILLSFLCSVVYLLILLKKGSRKQSRQRTSSGFVLQRSGKMLVIACLKIKKCTKHMFPPPYL